MPLSNQIPVWAVVPAAGKGRRMHSDRPKQYLSFQGKTILEHCLDRLLSHPEIAGAILVLHPQDTFWGSLDYPAAKPIFTADGGRQRQHSVYQGLSTLQFRCGDNNIALVHDSVRPLVGHRELDGVIAAARDNPAGAILAAPLTDTLKRQNDALQISETLPRAGLWRAMTPQVFHLQPLLNALKRVIDENIEITDDAQAVEMMGYSPALVAGSSENIKITTADDLTLAEQLWLNQRNQQHDK